VLGSHRSDYEEYSCVGCDTRLCGFYHTTWCHIPDESNYQVFSLWSSSWFM